MLLHETELVLMDSLNFVFAITVDTVQTELVTASQCQSASTSPFVKLPFIEDDHAEMKSSLSVGWQPEQTTVICLTGIGLTSLLRHKFSCFIPNSLKVLNTFLSFLGLSDWLLLCLSHPVDSDVITCGGFFSTRKLYWWYRRC